MSEEKKEKWVDGEITDVEVIREYLSSEDISELYKRRKQ